MSLFSSLEIRRSSEAQRNWEKQIPHCVRNDMPAELNSFFALPSLDTSFVGWYASTMDANELIAKLGLTPLSIEGGYFAETYRCDENIPASALDQRYNHDKSFSTAIYYLLTPNTISHLHRLASDEIFHFYAGDPVEMLQLLPDGSDRVVLIGSDIEAGQIPQVIVPRGMWQGCRLKPGGKWALLGTTVAPAFDYDDYEPANCECLIESYPNRADMIRILTSKM